jgi:2,3-bisphosphoglycerate-dependent phosphoglycerate mutase
MTNASLHRRPFLTPIWLTVLLAIGALCFVAFGIWAWATANSTTVIVIRHAEKVADTNGDPPLSPEGEARATQLSRMFGGRGATGRLDAIYVSPTLRSKLTAAPLAVKLGLTPIVAAADPDGLARRVLREHPGGRVLVVAHSDTENSIVEALSNASGLPPIHDDDFGTMFIVTVPRIGNANLLRMTY